MSPWEDWERDHRRRTLAFQREQRRRLLVGEPRRFSWRRYLTAMVASALVAAVLTLAWGWWGLAPSLAVALGLSWWVYRCPAR